MSEPSMFPPNVESPEPFATLRAFLVDAGYTADAVATRSGTASIYLFRTRRDGRDTGTALDDALGVLIRLFLDVETVEWSVVRQRIPANVIETFLALGLLADASQPDRCRPLAALYPAGTHTETGGDFPELYVCSDLNTDPDPALAEPLATDCVYPAITVNTGIFLSFLPKTRCDAFLELCSGSGIAALLASRLASRSWAVDITERSTRFATFNARLNQIENVVPLCGDLWEPVKDLTFDRIVAHPPYIPAPEQKFIFRDGGGDGERITAAVLAGIPRHLRPGGRFYCTCLASDRAGAPLEQRIREMMGPGEEECDVLLVSLNEDTPPEYYARQIDQKKIEPEEVRERLVMFREMGVERLVYSTMVVQRVTSPRPVFTERRRIGRVVCATPVDWLIGWETRLREQIGDAELLNARPRVQDGVDLELSHKREAGAWEPKSSTSSTDWPFSLAVRSPAWAATLLVRCDGQQTVQAHLEYLSRHANLGDDPKAALLSGIRTLTSAGILDLDLHPVPPVPPPGPRASRIA